MLRRLRDWLQADDAVEEKLGYRTATMVNVIAIVLAVMSLTAIVGEIFYDLYAAPPNRTATYTLAIAMLVFTLVVLILNRRGYTRLASASLLFLLWLSVTVSAFLFNGLFDISLIGIFVLMAAAGLLNGEQAVRIATALCLATLTFLLIANPTPKTITYTNAADIYFEYGVLVMVTLVMGYILFLVLRTGRRALESSRIELAERQRVEQAEREQRELAEALRDTAQALNRSLRLDDVLDSIMVQLNRVIPYDVASVGLLQGDRIFLKAIRSTRPDLPADKELIDALMRQGISFGESPILKQVITTGEALAVPDISHLPKVPPLIKNSHQRSFVIAPIRAESEIIGTLRVLSTQTGVYTEQHAEQLQAFAALSASSIQNARLFEVLQTYTADLEVMVEQATADLSAAKEQAESILEHGADGVLLLDRQGMVQVSNPAFEQMLGHKVGKGLKRKLVDLVPDEYAEAVRAALASAVASGKTVRLEIATQDAEGGSLDVDLSLTPVSNERGVVCLIHDISLLKQVERMKDAFVSIAAHELRTPLTSVLGFSEILLTRELEAQKARRYIQTINGQATQLKQIIDDLLDLTRLESGRALDLQAELLCLDDLIKEALEVFIDTTANRRFTFQPAAEKVWVRADPFRLAQVLRNLISNAVKYSTTDTEVEVTLRVQADIVQVSVRDEGIGMTPAQLSHMFEKFYRSRQAVQMSSGTGLGLSISKTIIEAHGGRIWVESEPDVGSIFSFVLPLGVEEPQLLVKEDPGDHRHQPGHA